MNNTNQVPWYKRTYRWGQINLTEIDPTRFNIDRWREYWRETKIQGIIINAGGIVSYYPSKYTEVYKAISLGGRDLYGEIVSVAHRDGLVVLARMDSSRVHEGLFYEHPEWCAVGIDGHYYKVGDLYITCINSEYYTKFLPLILQEIIERSHPEGFADNSFSGLDRNHICYCDNCARKFYEATKMDLPKAKDWNDLTYRKWIEWSYKRRLEIWEYFNQVVKSLGGKDCLWIGMIGSDLVAESIRFRDYKAICEKAEMILLDSQTRHKDSGFQVNGEAGKLIHELLGWDKIVIESMAMYQAGSPTFRLASKPEPEVRLWVLEGFAGSICPWWHHIGAYHEDRRQYGTPKSLFCWHEENEKFLINRQPIATVGLVWSQQNIDYYGRDDAKDLFSLPWQGIRNALIQARIPYLPINIDHIEKHLEDISLLILPNLGALSDIQCESIRRFVEKGGSIIATGETSLYNEWGEMRDDFALSDLFGVHSRKSHLGSFRIERQSWDDPRWHTYLRIECRKGKYNKIFEGFEETDILPFGGRLEIVYADENSETLLTFIPPFPIYPPETAWMRISHTSLPALIVRELANGSRIAYLAADIDRCYGRDNLPDHGNLLVNLVKWGIKDNIPLKVEGKGLIDCHLYHQDQQLILHVVNLTNSETWRGPVYELIPVGPFQVSIRISESSKYSVENVYSLVTKRNMQAQLNNNWINFDIPSILDHDVIVIPLNNGRD